MSKFFSINKSYPFRKTKICHINIQLEKRIGSVSIKKMVIYRVKQEF